MTMAAMHPSVMHDRKVLEPEARLDSREQLGIDIVALGDFDPRTVNDLFNQVQKVADQIDLTNGLPVFVEIDGDEHDVLLALVPDETTAMPGTFHDRLNRTFLPPGWELWHTKHEDCALYARPSSN